MSNTYIKRIMERLHSMNLYKVIVFGSYAAGNPRTDSDIDLLIVLDENRMPQTYDEWLEIKMNVRRQLRDINNDISIDLFVYTKPQYAIIQKDMNSFQKDIHNHGVILYEKAS